MIRSPRDSLSVKVRDSSSLCASIPHPSARVLIRPACRYKHATTRSRRVPCVENIRQWVRSGQQRSLENCSRCQASRLALTAVVVQSTDMCKHRRPLDNIERQACYTDGIANAAVLMCCPQRCSRQDNSNEPASHQKSKKAWCYEA